MARRRDFTIGVVLILIGGLFLLSNFTEVSMKDSFLVLVGLAFLIGYYLKRHTGYLIAGLVILAIGGSQIVDAYKLVPVDISEFMFLVSLGFVFLLLYFMKNIRGFIYPGCILVTIGLFKLIEDTYGFDMPWAFTLFIGVAFYLIYLIETRRLGQKWPLIPGTILIVISGLSYLMTEEIITISVWETISYVWPALLVLIGVKIIYNNIKIKK